MSRALSKQPPHTVIFTIGRMNPPTSGHMDLIKKLMDANISLPPEDLGKDNIYVILSYKDHLYNQHKTDKKSKEERYKNPLSCDRKKRLLQEQGMIQDVKTKNPQYTNINVHIYCMNEEVPDNCKNGHDPILKQICNIFTKLYNSGTTVTNMKLFLGEDKFETTKEGEIDEMKGFYYIKRSLGKGWYSLPPIEVELFPVDRTKTNPISATKIRGLVESQKEDDKALFMREYINNGLSEYDAEDLYGELSHILKPVVLDPRKKPRVGGLSYKKKYKNKQTKTRHTKNRHTKNRHTKNRHTKNRQTKNRHTKNRQTKNRK